MNSLINEILESGMAMYNWWNDTKTLFIAKFKENEFISAIVTVGAVITGILWLLKRITRR